MKKEMLAYFAGYLDADGSIGIFKHKSKSCKRGYAFELIVQVSGVKKKSVQLFHCNFGGSLGSYKNKVVKNKQKIWIWAICARKALFFLEQIYPYLILKKPQATIAVEFQLRKKWGQNLSDKEYQHQEKQRERISALNSKKPKDLKEIWGGKLIQELPI